MPARGGNTARHKNTAGWPPWPAAASAALALLLAACAPGMQVEVVDPVPAPTFSADSVLAPLGFDHVEMRVRRGRRIGSYRDGLECVEGGRDVWWGNGRVVSHDIEWGDLFHEQMTLAGYRLTGDPRRLFRGRERTERPAYLVSGQIEDIRLNLCEVGGLLTGNKLGAQTGEGSVRVYWQVYSPTLRQVVLEARSAGYFAVERPVADAADVLVREAFAEAVGNLAASPDLAALVRAPRPTRAEARVARTGARLWLPAAQAAATATPLQVVERARRAVVGILGAETGRDGGASGVLVAPGLVLTAFAAVDGAELVDVRLATGRLVPGSVERLDDLTGVALVRIDPVALPVLPLRDTPPASPGEAVHAITAGGGGTVSGGVVSRHGTGALGQPVLVSDAGAGMRATGSAAGGTGAALIDGTGHLLGIGLPGSGDDARATFVPVGEALRALNLAVRHPNDGRPAEGEADATAMEEASGAAPAPAPAPAPADGAR